DAAGGQAAVSLEVKLFDFEIRMPLSSQSDFKFGIRSRCIVDGNVIREYLPGISRKSGDDHSGLSGAEVTRTILLLKREGSIGTAVRRINRLEVRDAHCVLRICTVCDYPHDNFPNTDDSLRHICRRRTRYVDCCYSYGPRCIAHLNSPCVRMD